MKDATIPVADLAGVVDERLQRGISAEFERQLTDGILWPILERLQHDDTLSLDIRNGYVDIYYRGGRLLELRANAGATRFTTVFDENYCGREAWCPAPPPRPARTVTCRADAEAWLEVFPAHKQIMDIHFSATPKLEREYQQAVVRDNNRHNTGERSDYLIVDIEYAQSPRAFPHRRCDYRFDMVGFRWPLARSGPGRQVVAPVIMEMKAGDAALASGCGLAEHVADIEAFLAPDPGEAYSRPYLLLCAELVGSFATKRRLGLPTLPRRMQDLEIAEVTVRPEVVFVIANHQPASSVLHRELRKVHAAERRGDYYVATVEHAGYALFAENMVPLDEFVAGLPPEKPRGRAAALAL